MYQISEKWYGILLCDCQKELDHSMRSFLADLCKILDDRIALDEPDFFGDGSDDRPMRHDYVTATANDLFENLSEYDVFRTSYSGDGDPPYGIAVHMEEYPSWEVQNIIQSDKDNESQRAEAKQKFKEYCDDFKAEGIDMTLLLEKHNMKPDFLWTSSTS